MLKIFKRQTVSNNPLTVELVDTNDFSQEPMIKVETPRGTITITRTEACFIWTRLGSLIKSTKPKSGVVS